MPEYKYLNEQYCRTNFLKFIKKIIKKHEGCIIYNLKRSNAHMCKFCLKNKIIYKKNEFIYL
jgi:hypothetical protein